MTTPSRELIGASDLQQCAALSLCSAPFPLGFAVVAQSTLADPVALTEFNPDVVSEFMRYCMMLATWFAVLPVIGLLIHKRLQQWDILAHLTINSWLLGYVMIGHYVGLYTTPIMIVYLAVLCGGFFVRQTGTMLIAVLVFFVALAWVTISYFDGSLTYGPIFAVGAGPWVPVKSLWFSSIVISNAIFSACCITICALYAERVKRLYER